MLRILFFITLLGSSLTACGNNQLTVSDAWARQGFAGENSAVYMVIDNPTAQDDVLLSATSDVAEAVELHMSKMDDQGVIMMQRQEKILIAQGTEVKLEPGGLHIMLINLQQDLADDGVMQLVLIFENAGEMTLEVPIKSP
jgi:copper(I)-binding protein